MRAATAAEAALADATAAGSSLCRIEADRLLGELAAAHGDKASARIRFAASLALAERCRFTWEAALTRLARARALAGAPDAAADLAAVCAFFEEAGAHHALAAARKALAGAETGGPTAAAPQADLPDGLTAREWEVVGLVAQGLTDKEIGARLFISRKTVDRHLRNIFNKTGVSNRAALAAYATRHGLNH
ncbi:MAG TPA: response regulator transcription factor [Symbiobacteriaceae bacterium]|nr:response regulator transcription factor [Symbiobacteriaceae bacterium]